MPQKGWLCEKTGQPVGFDECMECAGTPDRCDFTPEILRAIKKNLRMKPTRRLSVTRLLGEPRQRVIEMKYDYYVSPMKQWPLARGTGLHLLLERAAYHDVLSEAGNSREICVDGAWVPVFGVVDVMRFDTHLIRDYKSCAFVPKYDKPYGNHALQLNVYRWMWMPRCDCYNLHLTYMDSKRIRDMKVEIMSLDEIETLLIKHATVFLRHMDSNTLPPGKPTKSNWQCRYCDVRPICEREAERGKGV